MPPEFVARWDMMLQAGLLQARAALGDDWLRAYLSAPLWHFVLGAEVLGPTAWAGVLMPGVDRVGRHFPLTIAAPVEACVLSAWLREARTWFIRCGELALATLGSGVGLAQLEAGLATLVTGTDKDDMPDRPPGDALLSSVADTIRAGTAGNHGNCVWWTDGGETLAPSMCGCTGLPDAVQIAGLFDGGTAGWLWHGPLPGEALE
ncbi:type VI secretion system-associated protein TagF [Paraburkholderia aromaticivorans]|uniref:type VI secretion system-associated protein TagF n=1 Tax=Paraburkholderia aromaticivorans TaxID=2026199 RepID=UPI001F0D7D42|nr:type VI secretion system-associated protein TagF [Paraburkholderia aromaticivorans]